MATFDPSARRTLAHGTVSRIDICGCDGIHLTIGAVTIRLPPGAFRDLTDTLGKALQQLEFMTAAGADTLHH